MPSSSAPAPDPPPPNDLWYWDAVEADVVYTPSLPKASRSGGGWLDVPPVVVSAAGLGAVLDSAYLSAITHRTKLLESTGLTRRESLIMAHSTLLPTLPAEVVPEGEPPLLLLHLLATLVSLALTYVPSHPSRFSFVSFLLEPPPSSFLSSLLPSVLPALPRQIAGALPLLCSLLPLSLLHSVAKPLHLPPAAHDLINCAFAAHWLSKTTLLTTVLSHALAT
ncbi:hypothetical protein TeGR_g782, partial [Tetraparma gracilis]